MLLFMCLPSFWSEVKSVLLKVEISVYVGGSSSGRFLFFHMLKIFCWMFDSCGVAWTDAG